MSEPVKQVRPESENKNWAIFPYQNEFAVCHLGTVKVAGRELFQSAWVIDHICPTMDQAVTCQTNEIKKAKVRNAQVIADMVACGVRRK